MTNPLEALKECRDALSMIEMHTDKIKGTIVYGVRCADPAGFIEARNLALSRADAAIAALETPQDSEG